MANWVFIDNGVVVEQYDDLPKNWRNITGLDLSANDLPFLRSVGWYPVQKNYETFNIATHKQTGINFVLQGDIVIESNIVEAKTQTDLDLDDFYNRQQISIARQTMRDFRDKLLAQSDWTQAADLQAEMSESQKTAWKNYRQALRDFPETFESLGTYNVSEIIFPKKPADVKIQKSVTQPTMIIPELNNSDSEESNTQEVSTEETNAPE